MRLLLSHGIGSQFVRQAARAFHDAGVLAEFWTSIARSQDSGWDRLLPTRVRDELRRRAYDDDILAKTHTHTPREALRLIAQRSGGRRWIREEASPISIETVIRHLDRSVARRLGRGDIDTVYAYEDGALHSFRAGSRQDIRCVYELPIGHWRLARRLFEEEAQLLPEWLPTMDSLKDSDAKLAGKDEEARLAQHRRPALRGVHLPVGGVVAGRGRSGRLSGSPVRAGPARPACRPGRWECRA